jgi:uncharacterized membrane protein YedE/YeeE
MSLFTPLQGILGGSLIGTTLCGISVFYTVGFAYLRLAISLDNKQNHFDFVFGSVRFVLFMDSSLLLTICFCSPFFLLLFLASAHYKQPPTLQQQKNLIPLQNSGGSAGVLLLFNGEIMGASGILSNTLIRPWQAIQNPNNHWRYVYLASFALTVNLFLNYLAPPEFLADPRSEQSDDVPIPSTIGYLLGGLLVGIGTRLGNGCTTGTYLVWYYFSVVPVFFLLVLVVPTKKGMCVGSAQHIFCDKDCISYHLF